MGIPDIWIISNVMHDSFKLAANTQVLSGSVIQSICNLKIIHYMWIFTIIYNVCMYLIHAYEHVHVCTMVLLYCGIYTRKQCKDNIKYIDQQKRYVLNSGKDDN